MPKRPETAERLEMTERCRIWRIFPRMSQLTKKAKWSDPPELTPQRRMIPRRFWKTLWKAPHAPSGYRSAEDILVTQGLVTSVAERGNNCI